MNKEYEYEKVVTTRGDSYNRIYLEDIIFEKNGFDIGQKITYYLDFRNKRVTILPLSEGKKVKYKSTITRRMKDRYVPVLNITNKDIGKVFKGITKCKIKVSKDEILVEAIKDTTDKNEKRVAYRIKKKELEKFYYKNQLHKGNNYFEFNDDPITNKFKELNKVKEDVPILSKTLSVLSLFSGIGAFELGLKAKNIDYELVNYCEIDKYASKAYCAIHNTDESLNLWDITKINIKNFLNKSIDLITHGSPCQDISRAGLKKGFDEDSNTRSSLLWKSLEIIKNVKPKFVIWENVADIFLNKNMPNVNKYMNTLKECGYTSYYDTLNSNEQGMPQNRSRGFVISILGKHKKFKFPKKIPLKISLQDFLTDNKSPGVDINVKPSCYKEFIKHYENIISSDANIYNCKAKSGFQDKRVGIKYCSTLRATSRDVYVLDRNKCVRRISEKESWSIMGFKEEAYNAVKNIGMSSAQMYKQIGNSIDVNVLKRIYDNLFKEYIPLTV